MCSHTCMYMHLPYYAARPGCPQPNHWGPLMDHQGVGCHGDGGRCRVAMGMGGWIGPHGIIRSRGGNYKGSPNPPWLVREAQTPELSGSGMWAGEGSHR